MHEITRKKLDADFLQEDELLKWPCPACRRDFMVSDAEKIFIRESSIERTFSFESLEREGKREFNIKPGAKKFFSVNLICDGCDEPAVVFGLIAEDLDLVQQDLQDIEEYRQLYNVEGVSLSLIPIHVVEGAPDNVVSFLQVAAKHMFGDIPACANYLRKAVEAIMIEQGHEGGTLHRKIEKMRRHAQEEADFLMAVKWIGNDGSHASERLTKFDIIEGFEALEEVLNRIYNLRRQERLSRARQRNTSR